MFIITYVNKSMANKNEAIVEHVSGTKLLLRYLWILFPLAFTTTLWASSECSHLTVRRAETQGWWLAQAYACWLTSLGFKYQTTLILKSVLFPLSCVFFLIMWWYLWIEKYQTFLHFLKTVNRIWISKFLVHWRTWQFCYNPKLWLF